MNTYTYVGLSTEIPYGKGGWSYVMASFSGTFTATSPTGFIYNAYPGYVRVVEYY